MGWLGVFKDSVLAVVTGGVYIQYKLGKSALGAINPLGKTMFSTLGMLAYPAMGEKMKLLNNKSRVGLTNEEKDALRPDFGANVDRVRIIWNAYLLNTIDLQDLMGIGVLSRLAVPRELLSFPKIRLPGIAAQTFGNRIYVKDKHRPGDASQLRVLAHEMVHNKQFRAAGSMAEFGRRYFEDYWESKFSYEKAVMEAEAYHFDKCFSKRQGAKVAFDYEHWQGTLPKNLAVTALLDVDKKPHVFFYNPKTGDAQIRRFALGSGSTPSVQSISTVFSAHWSTKWSHAVPLSIGHHPHILMYKHKVGTVHLNRIESGGQEVVNVWKDKWTTGWSVLSVLNLGGVPYLLLVKSTTGTVHLSRIDDNGRLTRRYTKTWKKGWTTAMPFGLSGRTYILLYNQSSGKVNIVQVGAGGDSFPSVYTGKWSNGWTHFEPLVVGRNTYYVALKGQLDLVTGLIKSQKDVSVPSYRQGEVHVDLVNSGGAGVTTGFCVDWSGGWTMMHAYPYGGKRCLLFKYKADTGKAKVDSVLLA